MKKKMVIDKNEKKTKKKLKSIAKQNFLARKYE